MKTYNETYGAIHSTEIPQALVLAPIPVSQLLEIIIRKKHMKQQSAANSGNRVSAKSWINEITCVSALLIFCLAYHNRNTNRQEKCFAYTNSYWSSTVADQYKSTAHKGGKFAYCKLHKSKL